MFETLDQVDWGALDDAYGPATGAPSRIRALASANKRKRDKALEHLSYTIYHQGTIYSSSVAAVPFLRKGKPEERLKAVSLLATLQDNPEAANALLAAALDPDPALSAAAISAAGACDEPRIEVFDDCFERANNELVRTVAALQILYHRDRNSPPAVVDYLFHHLGSPQPEIRKAY